MADIHLVQEAIRAAGLHAHIHIIQDGEQAKPFFSEADLIPPKPCPDVVILDINCPRSVRGDIPPNTSVATRRGYAVPCHCCLELDSAKDRKTL